MAFHIGKSCDIAESARINVREGFIGDGAIIREGACIEGDRVEIGREAYIDRFATIGGGSCFDPGAYLRAGDWFHMGNASQVNTARGVQVGHEVGCGIDTKVFTHGAYIDSFSLGAPVQWAPVEIGNSVWLPNAWVNPGVRIGSNVIVAARSLVNRDLPSGCLAGGVPAKVLKENWLPRPPELAARTALVNEIVTVASRRFRFANPGLEPSPILFDDPLLLVREDEETIFDLSAKTITGPSTPWVLMVKDQLRRNGIRFRYRSERGIFVPWKELGPDC